MVWALTGWSPTPSTSEVMLAALIRLFPKHNLWIWRWARALNFFDRPWSGTCPVKLLYGLGHHAAAQFQGLGLFSYRLRRLYVEQQLFFSDPQRVLCHEVPCWTSSDQYERVRAITPNLTHLLPIHIWDLVTLTSHMTEKMANWAQFGYFHLGVYSLFVASGLDINGYVLSYFEGTANLHC